MDNTALLIIFLVAPAIILWLVSKFNFLKKIGPVLLLYLVGIIMGNTGIISEESYQLQDLLTTIIVPIAIPLLLFSLDFKTWDIKNAIITLVIGVVAVSVAVVSGYFIFNPLMGESAVAGGEMEKVAGMLVGVYTGGTPNLAAIKIMLNVPNETYILIHSYDMAICFLYLTFILSFGIPLFRRLLPFKAENSLEDKEMPIESYEEEAYKNFFTRSNLLSIFPAVGVSVLIFAIAGGLSLILPNSMQMIVVILTITTLGIAASFVKKIREIESSYNLGMYLVYIFSIVVASMADLTKMDIAGGLYLLLYIAFAIFVSLTIQLVLSRVFKIDGDTVLVSSVALINSPPFVPLVAAGMKNRNVIITGLTVGLVGYAIGNYLGFFIHLILS